jgi:hypothetical protein
MTPEEIEKFKARVLPKMQLASAQAIRDAHWHVCTLERYPGSSQGKCEVCNATVWYSDECPAKKLCATCALQMKEFLDGEMIAKRNGPWDGYPHN